jgi:segregation and condensation protein A
MHYELKIENFSGPIEKLLELIEQKKLEITELSLAEVTADFLNYLQQISDLQESSDGNLFYDYDKDYLSEKRHQTLFAQNISSRLIADFVVIAARLLLIKSKALLPNLELTEDEKKDIHFLEERLRFYKKFKPAIQLLKKMFEERRISFSRYFLFGRISVFYPASNLNINVMHRAMSILYNNLAALHLETQTVQASLVSLEIKMEEILGRLRKISVFNFSHFVKESNRAEIVVLFLAVLHLLHNQLITVEQKTDFSDIIIKKEDNN